MSVRDRLMELLGRFDDAAFVALANRGLVRRAEKDLERGAATIAIESDAELTVEIGGHRITFDARGPAHARCSCPASGVCQHILSAAMALKRMAPGAGAPDRAATISDAPVASPVPGSASSEREGLVAALLAIPSTALVAHAGKAGYRWAWQFVEDLDDTHRPALGGDRYVVIAFPQPRLAFRYLGGGPESLIADVDVRQIEKYRVAAVLAFQRAHGVVPAAAPPTPRAARRQRDLDLGRDHAAMADPLEDLSDARMTLRRRVRELLEECMVLGLAHLSDAIHERFATLAVWAQGAELPRLALLLRRLADHVELLLERAGAADEHRLLDEIALTHALVAALEAADRTGRASAHLVGQARSRYDEAPTLALIGLGAVPWRSQSGYVGLTMLFWLEAEQRFLACTDARPAGQRFDPIARYKQPGPWSGLGAPAQTAGRAVTLTTAQVNAAGRLSGSEKTNAVVREGPSYESLATLLRPVGDWSRLAETRAPRGLLAEPRPLRDWVVLAPKEFEAATFDDARQTLVWPLVDASGERLDAELRYADETRNAILRIEALDPAGGTLVVGRLRGSAGRRTLEPASLVVPGRKSGEPALDALHFDPAPQETIVSRLLGRLGRNAPDDRPRVVASAVPVALRDLRLWIARESERGVNADRAAEVFEALATRHERLASTGFTAFGVDPTPIAGRPSALAVCSALIRSRFVGMQYEQLLESVEDDQD